jgi:hypothetical protein
MKHKVLLVLPNFELRDYVLDVLEDHFRGSDIKMKIDKEETFQDALDKCASSIPYSLVISQLHIARRRKEPLVEKEMLGLNLFRELSARGGAVPGILLTPFVEERLNTEVQRMRGVRLVPEGEGWEDRIAEVAEYAFNGLAAAGPRSQPPGASGAKSHKKVRLEFSIYPYEGTWHLHFIGYGGVLCNPRPYILRVNPTEINDIRDKVNRLDEKLDQEDIEYSDWKESLSEIGKNLVQEIIRNNQETLATYCRLRGEVGGCENFNLRFSTGEEAYPLLLEAILVPDSRKKDDFWMLKAPICRHVDFGDPELWPLFEDPERDELTQKINCLIIEANAHGWIKEFDISLKELKKISTEARDLKKKFYRFKEAYRIGRIEWLAGQDCTKERVKEVLTCGEQWHLVHYAGHSLHRDKGYVFFLKDGKPDPVDIRYFSLWLRLAQTRLIYLSGCQSCKISFVRELAQNGVPSAIGFRWKIDDKMAAGHADIFYDNLFKERSLENAFLKTRQKVWETNEDHQIWAAPVLMMQAHR